MEKNYMCVFIHDKIISVVTSMFTKLHISDTLFSIGKKKCILPHIQILKKTYTFSPKMKAHQVYQILNSVNNGQSPELNQDSLDYFIDLGVLSVLDSTFKTVKLEIAQLPELEKQLEKQKIRLGYWQDEMLGIQIHELVYPIGFRLGQTNRLFATAIHKTTRLALQKAYSERDNIQTTIDNINKVREERGLDDYIETPVGYVRLTNRGKNLVERLSRGHISLEFPYEKFSHEYEQLGKAISYAIDRFNDFYTKLVNEKGLTEDDGVPAYALALSSKSGHFEEIYGEVGIIVEFLSKDMEQDTDDSEIYPTIEILLNSEADLQGFKKLYEVAIVNEDADSYETLMEMAMALRMDIATPARKHTRFKRFQTALEKRNWKEGRHPTCYLGAGLGKYEGDTTDITQRHRDLENKIIEMGEEREIEIIDKDDIGMAAFILMDEKDTVEKRATRFIETIQAMKEENWIIEPSIYESVAFISMLPGSIRENVKFVSDIYDWFEDNDYEGRFTAMATQILRNAYSNLPGGHSLSINEDSPIRTARFFKT